MVLLNLAVFAIGFAVTLAALELTPLGQLIAPSTGTRGMFGRMGQVVSGGGYPTATAVPIKLLDGVRARLWPESVTLNAAHVKALERANRTCDT